jgi:tryptophan 2,3-dioxygenase
MSTAELRAWLHAPDPKKFPYAAVIRHYHEGGKHFASRELLELLSDVRKRLPEMRGPWRHVHTLVAFLSTALDKLDGRYDYTTYLALSLLQLPTVDDPIEQAAFARPRCDRLVVQLVSDLLTFEVAAMEGNTTLFPRMRPDKDLVIKRCKHGLRTIRPALARLSLDGGLSAAAPAVLARQASSVVHADMSFSERRALELSILPVYTIHDEYMFLRVLQAFETTFALLSVQIRMVVSALTEREIDRALHFLNASKFALHESAPLFAMLATMQVESFQAFRKFTEGASAIQSRNYKIVESLCREPDRDRVDSLAYQSVPEVRHRILAGHATLDDAYRQLCESNDVSEQARDQLDEAMKGFAHALLRWRNTHYRLAVRTLGEAPGSGFTEGTPYLDRARIIPVFHNLGVDESQLSGS